MTTTTYTTGQTLRNGTTYVFGPGALERIEARVSYLHGHKHVRVQGLFSIYCGMGNEHTVEINARRECIGSCAGSIRSEVGDDLYLIVSRIVDFELEDWFDPCDVPEPAPEIEHVAGRCDPDCGHDQ